MDPRLVDRRRRVAEDRARTNLRRLLRFLTMVAVVAVVAWVLQSPFLSLSRLRIEGVSHFDAEAMLGRAGIVPGRAMILLDVDGARRMLVEQPWVAEARVARDWPTTVLVDVTERRPAATVRFADGPHLVSGDGVVLEPGSDPALPVAQFPSIASGKGGEDLKVKGAVAFLAALPPAVKGEARVGMGTDGLEASVSGFQVRLGRPFDMEDKAVVTAELLSKDLEEGSVITVVAPASPAVLTPGAAAQEGLEEGGEGTSSNTTNSPDTTTQP